MPASAVPGPLRLALKQALPALTSRTPHDNPEEEAGSPFLQVSRLPWAN